MQHQLSFYHQTFTCILNIFQVTHVIFVWIIVVTTRRCPSNHQEDVNSTVPTGPFLDHTKVTRRKNTSIVINLTSV